jgi:ATP-binding cassette subfamily B multidrug efflux pump
MRSLRQLVPFLKPYWLPAVLAPLLMALEVAMDLLQPRFLQVLIDQGIARHSASFMLHTGLVMVGVALIGVIGGVGCTVFATIAALNLATSLRAQAFQKVQGFSFGNLDRLQTGGLITRLTNDVDQVQEAALMFLRILVRAPLLTVGSLIMAALTAPRLSLLLLFIAPLVLLLLLGLNHRAHPLFTALQQRLDRVNAVVQENLAGVRLVRAFVRGDYEADRFAVANAQLRQGTVQAFSLLTTLMPGTMLLLNLGVAAALWFGGVAISRGDLRVGQLLAFVNYLLQMLFSLVMVGMLLMRVTRADASAERILEVLSSVPEVRDADQALPAPPLRGQISFAEVSFSYGGAQAEPVLSKVSFTVKPGQTAVILGATGAGKSTLVHLIPRLYDVTAGQVLLDGHDVRALTQESVRRQTALVLQEAILFSGTVRENLRHGRPEATDAELEEAAQLACAHDFILDLPDRYDTYLEQQGANLSGGQKQRLALARALVARPAILLLDDCTSAVDMATEANLLSALRGWSHPCTRIQVAQRISAAAAADQVLVLEAGRLIASGTHAALLRTNPVYQEIARSQGQGVEMTDGQ